jgi:hypothetical protein
MVTKEEYTLNMGVPASFGAGKDDDMIAQDVWRELVLIRRQDIQSARNRLLRNIEDKCIPLDLISSD